MNTTTISDLSVVPARYDRTAATDARRAFRRDGAVTLTGMPVTAGAA